MAAMELGAEQEEECSPCGGFSLTCQEDGADLGDGVVDDGDLFLLYSAAAAAAAGDDDEYVEQLVSKETSGFFSDSGDADAECSSAASEDWFLEARLASVKWILQVSSTDDRFNQSIKFLDARRRGMNGSIYEAIRLNCALVAFCRRAGASASPTARPTSPSPTSTASASADASM